MDYSGLETLMSGGNITKAAIFNVDRGFGSGVRAASSGFDISSAEQKTIGAIFDAYKYQNKRTESLALAGDNFQLKEFRSDQWYRGDNTKAGADGIICYNTVTSIVVVQYRGTFQQAHAVAEGVFYDLRETGN